MAQQVGLYGHTGPVHPEGFPTADKLQHALGFALPMYMVLTTLDIFAARAGRTLRPRWGAVIAGVFATNAVASELFQARPGSGRSGDAYDALADLIGVALGWLVFRAIRGRRWVQDGLRVRDGA